MRGAASTNAMPSAAPRDAARDTARARTRTRTKRRANAAADRSAVGGASAPLLFAHGIGAEAPPTKKPNPERRRRSLDTAVPNVEPAVRTHRLAVSIAVALAVNLAGCAQRSSQEARERGGPQPRDRASQ